MRSMSLESLRCITKPLPTPPSSGRSGGGGVWCGGVSSTPKGDTGPSLVRGDGDNDGNTDVCCAEVFDPPGIPGVRSDGVRFCCGKCGSATAIGLALVRARVRVQIHQHDTQGQRTRVRVRVRVKVRWGPGCLIREHTQIGHFTPWSHFNVLTLTKCSYHKLEDDSG